MSARAYIEPGKIPPAVKELLETLRWESSPMTGM